MWAKPRSTAASGAAAAAEQRNTLWQVSVDSAPRAHDSVRHVTSVAAETGISGTSDQSDPRAAITLTRKRRSS
jgi:hypothetical protein